MSVVRTFVRLYLFALRFGLLNLLHGKIRRGLYLLIRPIDYWRVFEFPIALEYLHPEPGERILDVSSPKLLSLYLASRCGGHVYPMDIYDDKGLSDALFYSRATCNERLHVLIGDVRSLPFADGAYDKVFSISVLEHVSPPTGGDHLALKEIGRVLKPGGCAVVTIPFGTQYREEYRNEDIYHRRRKSETERVFYQRRHNSASLRHLLDETGEFRLEGEEYICERFFHWRGKELCDIIAEGNKVKRLSLAPFYALFAFLFLRRSSTPLRASVAMTVCLKLRKVR